MELKSKQLEFGSFRVDTASQLLLRDRKPIPLTPKAFDTLLFLLHNAHRLVTREELMKAVWPDSFVEDGNVSVNIFQLRKVLGETEGGRPFIETVPRKGYRFNAEVRTVEVETADGPLSPPLVLKPVETGRPIADAPEVKDNDGLGSDFLQTERTDSHHDAGAIVRGGALREVIPFPEPERATQPQSPLEQNRPTEVPATAPEPARSLTALRRWAFLAGTCLIVLGLIAAWSLWHHAQRPAQMVQRRITSFAPEMAVAAAAVSTGGKFIAYAIPAGLFVQVISTGETRALPLPVPHFAVSSISWFPDSASLLVDGSAPQGATLSLWIVPVIGTNPPIELGPYPPGTVSPDGSQIALVNNHGAAPEIQLMSAQGGGIRTLVTGGGGETFGSVRWFDNGQRLLFVRYRWNPQFRRNAGSIDAYDLTRGKTETIMAGSDFGGDAVSLPDGEIVYSKIGGANPATGSEVMEVRTNRGSGKASGAPVLLAKWDAPITDMTVNAAGSRLVLRDRVVQHDIYMADLKESGMSLAGVGRFSFGVGRDDFVRAWTPDSQAVFIDTNRNGNWQIYKRPLDSESDSPFVAGSDDQFSPRVSPDGEWLLYLERPRYWRETEPVDLMRVPIAGGLPQLVLTESGFSDWGLRFECPRRAGMPCILAQRQGSQVVFRAFDPVKGLLPSNREIARCNAPASIQWTLAPDGSGLAWINRNSDEIIIHVLSLTKSPYGFTSGRTSEFALEGWSHPRSIQWAPGGDGWFLVSSSESGWTLLYVNPPAEPDVLLRNLSNWAPDVYPSPDGRHLAFSKQSFSSNVWTLTHF